MAFPKTTGDLVSAADWNSIGSFLIEHQVLGSNTSGVVFAGFPQDFQHLRLTIEARGTAAATSELARMRMNQVTASSYGYQQLFVDGTTVTGVRTNTATAWTIGRIPAADTAAAHSGIIDVDIINYSSSTWATRFLSRNSFRDGANGPAMRQLAGEFQGTAAAVTRLDLLLSSGSWLAGSSFALYGIP